MKHNFHLLLPGIALTALFLSSCRKESSENEYDIFSARDDAKAEWSWNDIYQVVDQVAGETEGIKTNDFPCVDTCIVDTLSNPKTLLIDFGMDDCTSPDGRNRTGQLLISFTGRYRDPGTVISITPQNYRVDDFLIQGVKTITNMGENPEGHTYFNIEVTDASITAPGNEYTITWESSRTRVWIAGEDTWNHWDDVYEISGSGSGINRNGHPYSVTIIEPLRIELNCPWITAGVVKVEVENGPIRLKDYWDGACDGLVTVTVDGVVYQFYM